MKRLFIILTLLFTFVVGLLAGFIYLFDINDHSQWLSEQIEKSTGYQVRFELFENSYWQESRFSVSGLSIAIDKKELLQIDKINIVISELDLWDRQLEVELVELAGVALYAEVDALKEVVNSKKDLLESDNKSQLPWSKLQVNKLRISGLNADISNQQQSLRIQQASLSSDNLLIIEHNKLAAALLQGDLQLAFKALNLQLGASQAVLVKDFSLYSHFDLAALQAKLTATVKQLDFRLPEQTEVIVDNSLLEMQLDKNRISLTHLSANAFSGELELQADAQLAMHLQPTPIVAIDELTILSLLVKDMQIQIPAFILASESEGAGRVDEKQKLPIKTLFLQQVNLQNIAINSEEKKIPLTVKGLNGRLQDFYLLQNNQFVSLSEDNKQTGLFTLQCDSLQWADSVSEQFQVAGSFSEDTDHLLILKELLRLDGK